MSPNQINKESNKFIYHGITTHLILTPPKNEQVTYLYVTYQAKKIFKKLHTKLLNANHHIIEILALC